MADVFSLADAVVLLDTGGVFASLDDVLLVAVSDIEVETPGTDCSSVAFFSEAADLFGFFSVIICSV